MKILSNMGAWSTAFGVFVLLVASHESAATHVNAASHREAVLSVIEQFSVSIKSKDAELFESLFYSKSSPWIAVMSDESLKPASYHSPGIQKVMPHEIGPFIRWVVEDEESKEVRFSDIKVLTDGNVASVYCKYVFFLGGKKTNYGDETFTMINTGSAWKILAIAFSSTVVVKE